ncbi:ATP-dependent helicase [Candidatus Parcubacteria bacterium]|nr:MAG: ATP-dependent helicase [Candidatus Parcubacteria bacterium]
MNLSDEQQQVVDHRDSPLRVVAGPGTGKTMCLVARIVDLLTKDKIDPKTMLAVTFTRAAAKEMRQRLEREGIAPDRMPDVRTLHSKAMGILKQHADLVGMKQTVRPLSEHETRILIQDVMVDLNAIGLRLPFRGQGNIKTYLNAYRAELSGAGIPNWIRRSPQATETYHRFTEAYEAIQGFYGGVDWFRVVHAVLRIFEAHPNIREREQARIHYLLVDEYQDLNHSDQELVRLLIGNPRGLCVVGDEDQSIYETQRFARPNGLVDFHDRVAGTTTLLLTKCHRCPSAIIDKANALIRNNRIRIPGKANLVAAQNGGTVATFWLRSKKAEIQWLVAKVEELHERGAQYREMMILFGDGGVADDYISALRVANIPTDVQLRIAGPFDSECFAQLLAVLGLLADQSDNLAARQCLGAHDGIGAETIKHLRDLAQANGQSLWAATQNVAKDPSRYPDIRHRRLVGEFHRKMSERAAERNFETIIPTIIRDAPQCADDKGIGIAQEYFARQAGKENVMKLSELLQNFEQEREAGKLEGKDAELPDKVRILTMHSAKGLEAPIVFIPALEDDLMPGEMPNIEERRRLFFVSVTRSKQSLLMSWASQRTGRETHRHGGRIVGKERSRFLGEMGE